MMARHNKMASPNAPRIAPTAMKTVPSGRFDVCIKGAFWVGGTVAAGYVGTAVLAVLVLLKVGMSESIDSEELVERVGMLSSEVVVVPSLVEVVAAAVVEDTAVLVSVLVSVAVAVAVAVSVSALWVVVAVVSAAVVVSVAASTPEDRNVNEKTVVRSSERFRESCDALILAWYCRILVVYPTVCDVFGVCRSVDINPLPS